MKNIIKNIFFGIVIICFTSCKDETDLGNDFYYLPDYESIDIGYPYGTIVYKSNEKNKFEKILIYADVASVSNNDDYIIVKQIPNKKILLQNIKDDLGLWSNYYLEIKRDSLIDLNYQKTSIYNIHKLVTNKGAEAMADSILNNEPFYKKMFRNKYNYYIIEKTNDSVFGPLTLKEFEALKKEKKIDLDFED
jgi:hypothetical protein